MPPKYKKDYPGYHQAERQALLEGQSDDDDFFLNGPSPQTSRLTSDGKVNRLQGQVSEVINVMQDNIGKVLDRGDKLEDLQDKSENLTSSADMFRNRSKSLRNQMWWKECRMRIFLALIIIVILLVIIIPIVVKYTKK